MITLLEELSLNAWPSLQTVACDGWMARFANGVTKRANSVTPLYAGQEDLATKIRQCEHLYSAQNLPTIFKLTSAANPPDLDSRLAGSGYIVCDATSVQMMDLPEKPIDAIAYPWVSRGLTEEWLTAYIALDQQKAESRETLKSILENIVVPHNFFTHVQDDIPVACGIGVCERDYIGLFGLVVHQDYRRQGLGKSLIQNILAWGYAEGAKHAYLQVALTNTSAARLYAKLGFREVYQYWYRVKQSQDE